MVFTRVIQKHYPSHLNAQKQKKTRETNLELKRMEKDAASDQFRMNYGWRLTQRQLQDQRNKLMDAQGSYDWSVDIEPNAYISIFTERQLWLSEADHHELFIVEEIPRKHTWTNASNVFLRRCRVYCSS